MGRAGLSGKMILLWRLTRWAGKPSRELGKGTVDTRSSKHEGSMLVVGLGCWKHGKEVTEAGKMGQTKGKGGGRWFQRGEQWDHVGPCGTLLLISEWGETWRALSTAVMCILGGFVFQKDHVGYCVKNKLWQKVSMETKNPVRKLL